MGSGADVSEPMNPEAEQQPHWTGQFRSSANSFALFVATRPTWIIAAVLILASMVKSGFVVWNWFELSPKLLTEWSTPANAFQSNLLFNAFGTAWASAGLDTTSLIWQLVQIVITVAVFALIAVLAMRHSAIGSSYLPLAVILSSGLAAVLWREIGRYDAFFLAGVFIAVLAGRTWLVWLGVVIAATSSPEQLLVASIFLVLLSALPIFRDWRGIGLRLLAGSVAVLIAVQIWFTVQGDPLKTRIGILFPFASGKPIEAATGYDTKQGFIKFTLEKAMVTLSAGPALVWSYLGVATLLLVLVIVVQRSWLKSIYLLAVVIVIPIITSFVVGEDRTRDLALICAPMIIVLIVVGTGMVGELVEGLPGNPRTWLIWLSVLVTLIPLTYFYMYAEEPFRYLKELIIAVNNGVPLDQDGSAR